MERKYRQRGYMDSGRDQREERPRPRPETFGPKTPRLAPAHSVSRCGGCGSVLPVDFDPWGRCARCGFELHCCKQCAYFDPSSRFECAQPVERRVAQKDARNDCTFYAPRMTVERQTSPSSPKGTDVRKAFEDLFRK